MLEHSHTMHLFQIYLWIILQPTFLTAKSLIQGMKQACALQQYYILNVFQKQKMSHEEKENLQNEQDLDSALFFKK